jgi:hypothetical protein
MYKVERKMTNGVWYEVMLSPFKTREEIKEYYKKYSVIYPENERIYRLTNLETGGMKLIR